MIKTIEELQKYILREDSELDVLINQLTSLIYINGYMCHLKLFRGNKGWTINWSSNDRKEGTPNITTKSYEIKDVVIKALNYLIENKFHGLQNKDRNIFIDMITHKNHHKNDSKRT